MTTGCTVNTNRIITAVTPVAHQTQRSRTRRTSMYSPPITSARNAVLIATLSAHSPRKLPAV